VAIRVLIADDDALIREGLKVILQADDRFEVIACVENGQLAADLCARRKVDVALLDVRMPVMNGLEAALRISEAGTARPLILTTFDDDELVVNAVKCGARGYLLKSAPAQRIKNSIQLVAEGGTVMQDRVLDTIKRRLSGQRDSAFRPELFSQRELDVIKAVARGRSNREIAEELFMSEGTVKNHITSILTKTGLDHRTQIAIYYLTGETP